MLPRLPFRLLALSLFAVCAGMLAFGLYLQHVKGIEPCPMCILQRYALAACGVIGLLAGLQGPQQIGQNIYAGLLAVAALGGAGVAARQSWIQWYPPDVSECGPGLEYMLESFPLGSALPMIFRGAGDCSMVDWTFLGLTIANWSFISFTTIIVGIALFVMQRHKTST